MNRREFLHVLGAAAACGLPLAQYSGRVEAQDAAHFYDLPRFGELHFLHFTDCHAQLLPVWFREPNVNLGVAGMASKPPHLVGEALLRHFGIKPGTAEAYAFTYLDFEHAARTYGKVGGFAHLATLVKQLKADRPGALLLDGGDTWQGSATALWTQGQDMVDASKLLGVDVMTGHWEFTLGAARVQQIVDHELKGKIDFIAQNVNTTDFGDPVFPPYVIKPMNGVPVAIVGQAFPYTPIAHPRYLVPDWTFGIQEEAMQRAVDEARAQGRASGDPALAQRHGRRSQARRARARHRRDPRRPHPRRRARAGDREQRRRQDPGHQRRLQRQVPRRARSRSKGRKGQRFPLQVAAGVRQPAPGRSRRWRR